MKMLFLRRVGIPFVSNGCWHLFTLRIFMFTEMFVLQLITELAARSQHGRKRALMRVKSYRMLGAPVN